MSDSGVFPGLRTPEIRNKPPSQRSNDPNRLGTHHFLASSQFTYPADVASLSLIQSFRAQWLHCSRSLTSCMSVVLYSRQGLSAFVEATCHEDMKTLISRHGQTIRA